MPDYWRRGGHAMDRTGFARLSMKLEGLIEKKQESLDNAENASSPNEERIDKLSEEIRIAEEMLDLANEYVDLG
jgi:hypothetical protein